MKMENAGNVAENATNVADKVEDANLENVDATSEENLSDTENEEGLQMKLGGNRNECNVSLGIERTLF